MKYLLSALIIVSAALLAAPAMAHVVQATTSLSLADVDVHDKPQLQQALKSAVDQVLADVIAFKPTLVALTDAQVIGQRLYVRLLIADADGEKTLDELNQGDGSGGGPDENETPSKEGSRRVMLRI
jgi:hypothetical protein